MNAEQIALVQESYALVEPIADQAAALFYDRLFTIDPSARPLFHNDMEAQGRALMGMIKVAVGGLSKLDMIVPAVQQLGVRHAGYGVRPEHYETVGAALIWTLEQGLGDAFTPQVRDAWVTVYTLLADTMKEAAAAAPQS
ncbi:MAG TPA: globin family protein [Roseiflexaceae bacterium]|nr:globin family protein [Roseiflexaceae bacterium]